MNWFANLAMRTKPIIGFGILTVLLAAAIVTAFVAHSITSEADAATQIAASSMEQPTGVDQVGDAIKGIKLARTPNVESALQLESAAQRLQDLGQKLKLLAEPFQS